MFSLNLYKGKVISNNDSTHPDGKKLGRIQAKVLPEGKDVLDSMCPWFRPFLATTDSSEYSFNPPPEGALVWLISTPEFQNIAFYLPASFIDGFFNTVAIESGLAAITEADVGTYPDIAFTKTADGSIMFHNKNNGAMGIMHKSGSYVVITEAGQIVQRSSLTSSIQMDSSGEILVSGAIKFQGEPAPGSGSIETLPSATAAPPTGSGAFLAVPFCVVTGAPIASYKITKV